MKIFRDRYRILLALIILLGAFIRLWNLASLPSSLTPDEAALGYNSYSILKTGKDEFGKIFPAVFKSFGDYKPGFYVYLTLPFVTVLGLTELAVRLPSALAGIFSVYLIYLIVLKQTGERRYSLIAAFMASVTPWLIYFSRGAWEANLSLTFTLAGIYFFLNSFKKNIYLYLSAAFFALTLLTYQGAKLSTPLVIIILLYAYRNEVLLLLNKKSRQVYLSMLFGIIMISPIFISFFNGQTGRLDVFSIFSYPRPRGYLQDFLSQGAETIGNLNYYLFHSEIYNFIRGIFGRWFNHYSGRFLFFDGDYQNPMLSAPNYGMLLLTDLLLLPLGLVSLLRNKSNFTFFTLFWLLLSPLPAVLSRDQVQSVRSLNMAIPLVLISSAGMNSLLLLLQKIKYRKLILLSGSLLFLISLIFFIDAYFVHSPVHNAKYRSWGYKEVIENITPIQHNYDRIIFQQSYSQPYIYFLFYQKYTPEKYQTVSDFKSGGVDVGLVEKLDNISFESYSWPPAIGDKEKVLIVGNSVAVPPFFSVSDYRLIKEIKYPDNIETAFRILEKR